jgi:hypothetical protein
VCAGHADNRQAIFKQDGDGILEAVFIDHGHMFCSPKGNRKPHFIASRYYLDPRIYPEVSSETIKVLRRKVTDLDSDGLWARVLTLSDEWITHSALSNFSECLETLATQRSVERVLDAITRSQCPPCEYRRDDLQRGRGTGRALLRPAIRCAESDWAICA